MKIRTDFVTNSSSYCTTEIIIDNPALLEILQKYKDMGLFGDNDPIIGIGVYETMDERALIQGGDYQNYTKTPAFYYVENQNDEGYKCLFLVGIIDGPKFLDKVLEDIISIMDSADKYLDGQILTELKGELDQRKDEINRTYLSVYWENSGWGDCGDYYFKYEFDPINGSSYVYKDYDNVSTTEIAIDNPLLLEILQKYKGMGLFGDKDPIIGIGDFDSIDDHWHGYEVPEFSGVPAFYYYEQEGIRYDESLKLARFSPRKLVYVLEALISIMENGVGYLDEQIFARLKEELTQRKDEIDQAYSRVYWSYLNGTEGGKLEYDPINGESYVKGEHDHEGLLEDEEGEGEE